MADTQSKSGSKAGQEPVRDLVALDEERGTRNAGGPAGANGSAQDSIVNAAAVFEQQLDQMTAWKHQLAAQMEILRRDGIKILERQKQLAIEKKKLADDREAMQADRTYVQTLHEKLQQEREALDARAVQVEQARAELDALQTQKAQWLSELSAARQSAEETAARRDQAAAQLAASEAALAEFKALEAQRTELEAHVEQARTALGALQAQTKNLEESRHALALGEAELQAREKGLQELESKILIEDVRVRETVAQVEAERRQLAEAHRQLETERSAAAALGAEGEAKLAEARRHAALQSATAEEQLAEATRAMETINEQRGRQEQRWTALESRAAELAAQEETGNRKLAELTEREAALRQEQHEFNAAQAAMLEKQEGLIAGENALEARRSALEEELARHSAHSADLQKQLETERAALGKTRAGMQKRLEQAEQEHAEQLEILAKQTKRLSERRAELEAATVDLQAAIEQRVAQASEGLKEELARQQASYEEKLAALVEQVRQADAYTAGWRDKEQELLAKTADAQSQVEAVRAELARVQKEQDESGKQRTELARDLAEQVMHFEREAAEWQRKLEAAIAENQGAQAPDDGAAATRTNLNTVQAQLDEVCAAREDLEHRLATIENTHAERLENLRCEAEQLLAAERAAGAEQRAAELARRDEEIAAWRTKFEQLSEEMAQVRSAPDGAADATTQAQLTMLGQQLKQMEFQRNELATQLFATQDMLQRQGQETLLSNSATEAQRMDLERKIEALEAEKSRWSQDTGSPRSAGSTGSVPGDSRKTAVHHQRLLRQARNLRAYRRQVREVQVALDGHRQEVAEQRDQLRCRKENLEQVKRLLEKQEMVMARKLADHNALKTVAAVGIFVIMVLGSVFVSVYKFVNPEYRSEAVVQLAAPQGLQGTELLAWENRQRDFVRNNEVTYAAWKILRNPDEKYAMHDVRDEWLASLAKHLDVQLDAQTRTLAIRYTGVDAPGVAQVCNSLASALVNPVLRDSTEQTRSIGAGSTVLAKATPPMYPAEDNRLMISLGGVASVLFVSLLFVIMFRHYVARQLREIDQMADEEDLDDIQGEMPADVKPV